MTDILCLNLKIFTDLLQSWVGFMKSQINLRQLAENEALKLSKFSVLESKILSSHMKTQV